MLQISNCPRTFCSQKAKHPEQMKGFANMWETVVQACGIYWITPVITRWWEPYYVTHEHVPLPRTIILHFDDSFFSSFLY
jgi:hypothetical protein